MNHTKGLPRFHFKIGICKRCGKPRIGLSKYCPECKTEVRRITNNSYSKKSDPNNLREK